MRKLLLPLTALLLAVTSCYKDLDPFEGTDGIRFNLNGKKYVQQSGWLSVSPLNETEDGIVISSSMSGPSFLDLCTFTLNLCPLEQLTVDKEFKTGENGISAEIELLLSDMPSLGEVVSAVSDTSEVSEESEETATETKEKVPPVQMSGWVKRVASETGKLEVLFELSGKDEAGNQYELKHGFLRL